MEYRPIRECDLVEVANCSEAEASTLIGVRDLLFDHMANQADLTPEELCGGSLNLRIANARAAFVWLFKHYQPDVSYSVLTEFLNYGTDRAAIKAHTRSIALRLSDPVFFELCEGFLAARRNQGDVPYACA